MKNAFLQAQRQGNVLSQVRLHIPEYAPVAKVRLQVGEVDQLRAVNTLRLHAAVCDRIRITTLHEAMRLTEAVVRDVDRTPREESSNGRQVDEPVEHLATTVRDVHEREEGEHCTEEDGDEGHAVLRALGKYLRRLTTNGKPVEDARRAVQVTVGGRERAGEDGGVDDGRQARDTSAFDRNDVG